MKHLASWAGALLLALLCVSPAAAQSPNVGKNAVLPSGYAPGTVIYCDDGTGHVALCSFAGGGGGGSGDASAANQTTQITAANLTNTRIGDITSPATGSTNARLSVLDTRLQAVITALGTPLQAGGSVTLGGTLPAFATVPTVDTVVKATSTDRGAVVGTTAVQLMAANASRRGFSVQVQGAPDTNGATGCWISGQATATADYHSLYIGRGTYFETAPSHVGTGAISVICSAASISVYAREY